MSQAKTLNNIHTLRPVPITIDEKERERPIEKERPNDKEKHIDKEKPADKEKSNDKDKSNQTSNDVKKDKKRQALYTENFPTFYVGAGNNSEL